MERLDLTKCWEGRKYSRYMKGSKIIEQSKCDKCNITFEVEFLPLRVEKDRTKDIPSKRINCPKCGKFTGDYFGFKL
jgi:hypothetical protein